MLAEVPADIPAYSRDDWKHWVDTDGDCQNTRAEVLIEESSTPPTFNTDRNCRVIGGNWDGPYTGEQFEDAGDVDIDHLIPLKNAHLSGGWQWDAARKADYANSMAADYHLIAVDKTANRQRAPGDQSNGNLQTIPTTANMPRDWIAVKGAWGLSATTAEWIALETMLGQCPLEVRVVDGEGTDGLLPTAEPTPPPTAIQVNEQPSGLLVITEFMADPAAVRDAVGEWFEVYNPSPQQTLNLNGWRIRDGNKDNHLIALDIEVAPQGYLVLGRNSDETLNGGNPVGYEYHGFNLTNTEDAIELVDFTGRVVDRVAYDDSLVFPGASTSLDLSSLDADAIEDSRNWCRASSAMENGDFGTPGGENDAC